MMSNSERLSSITPCAYPLLSDTTHCGIDDTKLKSVQVCDPDKAISMSEIEVIKNKLDSIYQRNNNYCICHHDQSRPCWFQFGFAFLRYMYPVQSGVSHLYSREFCPANETLLKFIKNHAFLHSTREDVINYGENFARLLRERWIMGKCDEDILFFIVLKRPDQLIVEIIRSLQYIFASYGSLVQEKIGIFNSMDGEFLLSYHRMDPLKRIVEAENVNFENGYSLKAVTENLLDRFTETLSQANKNHLLTRTQSHIPDWALIVFVTCAFLCLLMTIGLCLMRRSVRRGSPRSKPMDTTRRWKAGFVGGKIIIEIQISGSTIRKEAVKSISNTLIKWSETPKISSLHLSNTLKFYCEKPNVCIIALFRSVICKNNLPSHFNSSYVYGNVAENLEGMPTGGVNLMQMMIQPSLRHSNNLVNNFA
ncbi:unnamed protein product [Thelazia callipaeda]|uniref:Guanylate cyclase n=1 Tax=Thelazia callipaeda TaxID=103827 RepID=A0A0N5D4B9_THECL|nr:unnamed protein product [Thelazia callipaeda]